MAIKANETKLIVDDNGLNIHDYANIERKKTCNEKWNCDNPFQAEEIKQQIELM